MAGGLGSLATAVKFDPEAHRGFRVEGLGVREIISLNPISPETSLHPDNKP